MASPVEPSILVERHHIPLSVYLQIYTPNQALAAPPAAAPNPNPNGTFRNMFSGNRQPQVPYTPPISSTIRATRRTTVSMPATDNQTNNQTNNPDGDQPRTQTHTGPGRNNNRISIETLASGDDNDVNLFNALFAALINPSRLDISSSENRPVGLTTEQIADNSTIVTYDDSTDLDGQPSSTICSICTLEYEPGQQVRSLDHCDHSFHTGCIDRWLADHNTCPLCRADIIPSTTSQQRATTHISSSSNSNLGANTSSRTTTTRVDLNGID